MFAPVSLCFDRDSGFKGYVRIGFVPKTEVVVNGLQVFIISALIFDGCARLGTVTICFACFTLLVKRSRRMKKKNQD
jgi:hypothetical protein